MMLEVNDEALHEVNGGKFHIGGMISSLVVGFVVGGPIGLGFAASGIIMTQGINNLHDLYSSGS
ncbi:class IIb bacteriocin, lactobin A/cerein 7B family [Candidatus Berkiella aquae]|uniref:Class IIb bacteriocin, lactobin A/cerein 7B family n=1 Tax=Candidatus Berkiella aquae TaxID=295108 RepID=A0A0Q9YQZ0_9GAMM|nr:class IIb bacteriocin, lactobin A/cerein 7B family [Candidatus Berkiella aquae]MCS5709879.1 class IIb bacteriocin, lactobin A/cerein 7B family [Candidatus Berkiella aquae]